MKSFATGWRQVGAAMMVMACSGMVASTYGIVAVPIAGEFDASRMVVMLAITVMSIATAVLSPIVGGLMDRTSLRRIMGIGVAGLVCGYLALSLVTSFVQVMIVFGLFMAAAQAMAGPIAGTVLLARWFEKRRGAALGIAISGIAAGTVVFPLVIQALLDTFAWRDALRVLALILLVCTVPALALIVNRPEDKGLHPDGAEAPPVTQAAAQAPALSTREILADPAFWLLAAVVTTILAGMMGSVTNVVPMARDLGIEAGPAAAIVSIYAGAGFIAKLSFGALADRLNPRGLMLAILALFAAGMAAFGVAAANGGYWMIVLGACLVGTGGMIIPLQSFITPRIFGPLVVGRATGLLSLVSLCGLLATPPIFGFIFDRTGSYATIFFVFAALSLLAMLPVPKIRLHPRGTAAHDIVAATSAARPEPEPVTAP